jgi:hypothetical protein
MSNTDRRRFLKGMGATLATLGLAATAPTAAQATAVLPAVAAANRSGGPRLVLPADELDTLIVEELVRWVAQRQRFTAYDLTRALRSRYPRIVIMHDAVRCTVHRRMAEVVARQFYAQTPVQFAHASAIQYAPL